MSHAKVAVPGHLQASWGHQLAFHDASVFLQKKTALWLFSPASITTTDSETLERLGDLAQEIAVMLEIVEPVQRSNLPAIELLIAQAYRQGLSIVLHGDLTAVMENLPQLNQLPIAVLLITINQIVSESVLGIVISQLRPDIALNFSGVMGSNFKVGELLAAQRTYQGQKWV